MNFIGIIPARYASTRFPGKPLCMLGNMTMIERVYRQVSKVKALHYICVATDDERIYNTVKQFGGNVVMTSPENRSGTDRCADALHSIPNVSTDDVVINIQGDEPFIQVQQIESLIACFNNPSIQIATLIKPLCEQEDINDPNVVKVVKDINNNALYFSRYPIPYLRNTAKHVPDFYQHIGIYAYRVATLKKIVLLPSSSLEQAESLEQLRWLENAFPIHTEISAYQSIGIDTPADMEKALKYIQTMNL